MRIVFFSAILSLAALCTLVVHARPSSLLSRRHLLPYQLSLDAQAPAESKQLADPTSSNKPLWGINYSPYAVQRCRTDAEIQADLRLLDQWTSRVRIYGLSDCNQLGLRILSLLPDDMQIAITLWGTRFAGELATMKQMLAQDPERFKSRVIAVFVGSEVLFRGEMSPDALAQSIRDTKAALADTSIPVGSAEETKALLSAPQVCRESQFISPTLHPFFGGGPIAGALNAGLSWLLGIVSAVLQARGKTFIIAEIGWPTAGNPNGLAVPSLSNMEAFLKQLVCRGRNDPSFRYFLFEAFDADWKVDTGVNGVERSWGLYTASREAKVPLDRIVNCQC